MTVSKRASSIPSFIVMDVLEKAQELAASGREIIHLEVGEPDFATPEIITRAAVKAMEDGHTHYTHSLGITELRKAVCRHYENRYGVNVDPGRVIVTAGTSTAMLLLFSALLEKGQEIILSDPHYACYDNFISFVGGVPVRIPVRAEEGFQLRPEEIRAAMGPLTRAIFINSPSNPTGQVMSPELLGQIADMAPGKAGGPYVISDEIYHGLVYEGSEHSILQYTDNAFVLDGFSKRYAMSGRDFGPGGYGFLRFSYCNSLENIEKALGLLKDYVNK